MKAVFKSIILLTGLLSFSAASLGNDYDVVISNGRVMDPESGLDAVRYVGIKGNAIASISEKPLNGKRVIDATGHVVAPGFIDPHVHTVSLPFGQKLALRDGVTTPMELELGAYPVDLFYDNLEGKSQTNYGATVSLMGAREKALNPKYNSKTSNMFLDSNIAIPEINFTTAALSDIPSDEEIDKVLELVEEGLKRGALGIGNTVGYMSKGVTSREMVGTLRLAGEYNVPNYLHGRFSSHRPPTTGVLGTQEVLSGMGVYGGSLYVMHIHQQTLNDTMFALDMLTQAQEQRLNVVGEIYPYNYGATVVGADYLVPSNYGPNMGRDYSDIVETKTMTPLTKERYEELVKADPTASVTFKGIQQDLLYKSMAYPGTVIGSDAFPLVITETGEMAADWDTPYEAVQGHPRAAGSHARVLRLVREENLMPLMLAISKMSYMHAKFMENTGIEQMAKKGRIQKGADADIVIFNPNTVTDNSTDAQAGLPSTGIPYVIVNGTVVVDNSKVQRDVFPGQPIRRAVK